MESKNISLVIAGGPSDGHRQVIVNKETTVIALLQEQNLEGYQLSLGTGKAFLAGGDKLHGLVNSGDKVYATTKAQQG